jgi:hypothetical protein
LLDYGCVRLLSPVQCLDRPRTRTARRQRVRELMLQEAGVAAVSWRVRLAVLKDAKLDVTALSEPLRALDG